MLENYSKGHSEDTRSAFQLLIWEGHSAKTKLCWHLDGKKRLSFSSTSAQASRMKWLFSLQAIHLIQVCEEGIQVKAPGKSFLNSGLRHLERPYDEEEWSNICFLQTGEIILENIKCYLTGKQEFWRNLWDANGCGVSNLLKSVISWHVTDLKIYCWNKE